jgi:hypothetical protein
MFNTNNLFKLNGVTKGMSMTMSSFLGNSDLVVFSNSSSSNGPMWKFPLGLGASTWLTEALEKVVSAPPGSRKSLIYQDWDFKEKKFKNKRSLTIGKGDDKVIYIGCQGMSLSEFETFKLDMFGYDESPNNLSPEEKSRLVALGLIEYIKNHKPINEGLSKDTVSFNKQKEKWQNKGNYNKNNYKNNNSPNDAGPSGTDDDIPF